MANNNVNDIDLQELYQFTLSLARTSGTLLLQGSQSLHNHNPSSQSTHNHDSGEKQTVIGEKKNAVDLVTEWDSKIEQTIKERIEDVYPEAQFIGEESYKEGAPRPALSDSITFCVDPIDGTTNFIHGFPHSCISIGVLVHKIPTIGVIYNPFLDQLWHGLKGNGAFLSHSSSNTETRLPLRDGPLEGLSKAAVALEWGSDRSKEAMDKKLLSFSRLMGDPKTTPGGKMIHAFRSIGSAALNFCSVAAGSLDLYWEIGCWPWDVCAGIVIAQESGAYITGGAQYHHLNQSPFSSSDGVVDEEFLWGRKYIVVRSIKGNVDKQKGIVKEFYETVEDWDPN